MHNLGDRSFACKRYFATQHHLAEILRAPVTAGNPLLRLGFYHRAHAALRPRGRDGTGDVPAPARLRRSSPAIDRPGPAMPLGGRRGRAGRRHSGASAGGHQPGRERSARSGHRRRASLALDGECRGRGHFYDSKAEAVAAVRAMQARGIQSIDVGCGQINLMHHPDAFANLELAFDPQANATYAARFPQGAVRADRRLEQGGGDVSLGDTRTRRRLPAERCWQSGRRSSGSPAWCGATAVGAGLGRHDGGATAELHARAASSSRWDATQAPRIIMLPTVGGVAPPGRGLDAYRAAPIGLAFQPPPRRIGG